MMKHSSEFLAVISKLEPLLREDRKFCLMPYGLLCDWIAYFWNRGTISYLIDDDQARGVCLIKLFRHLGQFLEPFVHDPCGKFCMVETLVAKDPIAIAHAYFELKKRWGKPAVMMWDRGERTEGGPPRLYTWDQYERLTRRLTYGLILEEKEPNYG
jgi:hypothetical protein